MIHNDRNGRTLIGHGVHPQISWEESFKWDPVASFSTKITSQMVLRKVGFGLFLFLTLPNGAFF